MNARRLLFVRHHINGAIAELFDNGDGTFSGRQRPDVAYVAAVSWVDGFTELREAQRTVDDLVHPDCDGLGCRAWSRLDVSS